MFFVSCFPFAVVSIAFFPLHLLLLFRLFVFVVVVVIIVIIITVFEQLIHLIAHSTSEKVELQQELCRSSINSSDGQEESERTRSTRSDLVVHHLPFVAIVFGRL